MNPPQPACVLTSVIIRIVSISIIHDNSRGSDGTSPQILNELDHRFTFIAVNRLDDLEPNNH
jgi:hypothetical protein